MHRVVLALAATAALLVMACGGTSTTSSPDPAAACEHAAMLAAAVQGLDAVDLTTVGNDDLKASIDAVAEATGGLIRTATPETAQTMEDMEGAVNILEAAYVEASSGSIAESAAAIDAAIVGVTTQANAAELAVAPSCP